MKTSILVFTGIFIVLLAAAALLLLPNVQKQLNPHAGHSMEAMNHEHVVQSHNSYQIEVVKKPQPNEIKLNQPATIMYKIKNNNGETLTNFATAHEKIMHFIIIRKDLTLFQHLHPKFDKSTGEFSVDVAFSANGPYRFFADFVSGDDQLELPVSIFSDIDVGDIAHFKPQPLAADTTTKKTVPPNYQVSYAFPNPTKSLEPVTYSLLIEKNNEPVTLETYLGALGHSVILKEGTLEYIHAHPNETKNSQQQNKIDFTTTFPAAGIYKIFTQFQVNGKVSTSEYTLGVK